MVKIAQPGQPAVGNGYHPHIGVDGAEGVIGALGAGVGNGVEQGRLAHVGQTHDA